MKKLLSRSAIAQLLFIGVVTISFTQLAAAQDPNQAAADQEACQQQAIAYSGYNPAAPPQQTHSPPPPQRGAGLRAGARGAVRGAVAGNIVKEIDDDGDRDDADELGAALGGMRGVSKGRRASRDQAAATQPPSPAGDPNVYTKSFNDCMLNKGYIPQN